MKKYLKFQFSTTHIIMLSFLCTIFLGSMLLSLPISSASGDAVPYLDALFTATTATCVTGLVTLPTVTTWSIFGQAVILFLIQVGGLGVITILSALMILLQKRMNLSDRLLLQDAFNLNSLSGIVRFVKRVLLGTFLVEAAGALLYMTVFVPEFGIKGIWISVFTSISAFCNAGIDIIAENSLCNYATNLTVNTVTCLLIILSGLGYIVWWDLMGLGKKTPRRNKKFFSHLTLHSKIAITTTLILIFGGGILIFLFEYNNPLTIGNLSVFDKIQVSLFQSVTTRTAGFATVPQQSLTNASSVLCLLLMFIGGSPVGTAGGIKTTTAAVLFVAMWSTIKGKNFTAVFNRKINAATVRKALSVTLISISATILALILMLTFCEGDFMDVSFEVFSAIGTVGLTRNLTAGLNTIGRIIIIVCMYLGRTGPISLVIALNNIKAKSTGLIEYPEESITVG